eukprot:12807561-Heterocapsa_arctica.AAC.1
MTPLDSEGMAYASTFEVYMECETITTQRSSTGDIILSRRLQRNERGAPESHQHKNEGSHRAEYPEARADLQTTGTRRTDGHAKHHQLLGNRTEALQHERFHSKSEDSIRRQETTTLRTPRS